MGEHTRERLRAAEDEIETEHGAGVATTGISALSWEDDCANAIRLAVCWNYCRGFDNETLLAGPSLSELVREASENLATQALAPSPLVEAAREVLSRIVKTPSGYLSIVDDEPTRNAIAKLTEALPQEGA